MPRGQQINCEDIWKEVFTRTFNSVKPTTEFDKQSIRELAILYRDAVNMVQNPPEGLSHKQIQELRGNVKRLKWELEKQITLVQRLDTSTV